MALKGGDAIGLIVSFWTKYAGRPSHCRKPRRGLFGGPQPERIRMTLEEAIEAMENLLTQPESWSRLVKNNAGWVSLDVLKWLKELKVRRDKDHG